MIDTHCHIHFRGYKDDMEEVIKRTQEKGVRMITIGSQAKNSKEGIAVAEKYDGIWCTVGVHPSHTHHHTLHVDENETIETKEEGFDKDYYRSLIESSDKVVAIGEVGLDYYRLDKDIEEVKAKQREVLIDALDLADEMRLPLVLHVRDAHADMVALLSSYVGAGKLSRRGVIHCFTGTTDEARAYHEIGFLTSFTGIVTFPDKKDPEAITPLQQTVIDLPLEMIMVETDAPWLTPMPDRGKRNEPWQVIRVAEKIADLKGISIKEVDRVTTANAERLFGI